MSGLLKVIRDRHTTREPFNADRPIAKPELKMILDAARWAPTPNNMQNFQILIADKRETLEAIAKIPAEMSESFLRENFAQLSFTEDELRIKKIGMLASAFPKAWTDPEAWNATSDYRTQLTFLGRSVQETPLLLFVLYDQREHAPGEEKDLSGHMGLGCIMENMWLMSESLGIGFHVLTVFSNGRVEKQAATILHLPAHMKIAFACALGYPQHSAENSPRVRRDLEEFVHHNQFGVRDTVWSAARRSS